MAYGFVVPDPIYVAALALTAVGATLVLYLMQVPVTNRTVVALAPWMVTGSALHVLWRMNAFPDAVAPLFSSPSVYVTTYVVAAFMWGVSRSLAYANPQSPSISRRLGSVGLGAALTFIAFVVWNGMQQGTLSLFWPVIAFAVAGVVAAVAWALFAIRFSEAAGVTGAAGALVVYGHALDGISTAVAVDVLGLGESMVLSRTIIDLAARLPTAEYVGTGWLFVLVKLLLAALVVVLFRGYVREDPVQGRLLLAFVAAVGLGPGSHNLLLFLVGQ